MKLASVFALIAFHASSALAAPIEDTDPVITDIIYMETSMGAFEIGLFGDVVPQTANNFAKLAPIYQETKTIFHRIISDFVLQAGDIDGQGGHSIYGERGFDKSYGPGFSGLVDENFKLKHDKAGRVSVANAGPNTGGSQFFICLSPQAHLDGKHVVFGQVIKGMDVIYEMGKVKTDKNDKPIEPLVIEKCSSKSVRDVSTPVDDSKDVAPPADVPPMDNSGDSENKKTPETGNETPAAPADEGGATKIVFLPLAVFAIIAIVMGIKNKNKVMYAVRGPRYRRVISVNGDSS